MLWAIIVSLTIAIVALWPSKYPYREAPNIHSQEKTENRVGRDRAANERPSSPIETASEQQAKHAGENASEFIFLGIKPGEWLLGIATWMLWLATVRLVKKTEDASRRQLRAYVGLQKGEVVNLDNIDELRADLIFRNAGQTPAYKLRTWGGMSVRYEPRPKDIPAPARDPNSIRKAQILPDGEFGRTESGDVPFAIKADIIAGKATLFVYGEIYYTDAFGRNYLQTYRYFCGGGHPNSILQKKGKTVGRLAPHEGGNDEVECGQKPPN
ncbi:hypothetical protein [Bradyrhizobium sp.]|uniref:hypothetical protein n=1 Tax=Bradyrhizobium sp. TaxID=376 RepID=UPI0026119E53|nr:hypothetical protein [Bradyrhizobium sp.]